MFHYSWLDAGTVLFDSIYFGQWSLVGVLGPGESRTLSLCSATIISFEARSLNTILGAVKVIYLIPTLQVPWKSGVPLPWLSLVGNHRETASWKSLLVALFGVPYFLTFGSYATLYPRFQNWEELLHSNISSSCSKSCFSKNCKRCLNIP